MKRFTNKPFLRWMLLLGSVLGSLSGFSDSTLPLSQQHAQVSSMLKPIALPSLNNQQLIERDRARRLMSSVDRPVLQFAEPLTLSVQSREQWERTNVIDSLNNEHSIWRMRVRSPGALSVNLGFQSFYLPEGARLFIYSHDQQYRIRPFTHVDNDAHGQLWTPMLPTDDLVIELNVPTHLENEVQLQLAQVNHGYLGRNADDAYQMAIEIQSGSCNVDVVCSEGDNWRDQIRSVATYSLGGSTFCTGAAINNTAQDGRPFFLTADHCGVDVNDAPSLVVYWNFENSYCRVPGSSDSGGPGDGQLNQFSTGAIFRADYSASDMTLVELDDPIDPSFNVYLAGWNRGEQTATSAVAIHHPNTDEKRISFENDPVTITSYGGSTTGSGTHVRVADWDLGTTEPGSSGSPLFDQNKRIIGQLHGGSAACGNNSPDWYGWLKVSWTGGGTSSTRLSNWLDSANTNEVAIDGRNASGTGGNNAPIANFSYVPNANDPLTIQFTDASTDSDGSVIGWNWDFGDGINSTVQSPVHSFNSFGSYNVSLTVTDNEGKTGTTSQTITISDDNLQNGVPIENLSGAQGEELRFTINIPADARNLRFAMSGGSGDADLYTRFGSEPSTSNYDCRPYSSGNNENCDYSTPSAGTYHVMIRGYRAFSGVSLVATYTVGTGGGDSGSWNNLSASRGEWIHYTIDVPAGMSQLKASIAANNGDADLYVRYNARPTTSRYDCRPYSSSSNETCTENNPQAGTWHLSVRAYRSFNNLTLSWEYQ